MIKVNPKHVEEADKVGLVLLGSGRNTQYRNYQFKKCGHEQEIQIGHVRINTFKCMQCLQDKLDLEASEVGLILLGDGRKKPYLNYQFKSCSHTQEIPIGNVRINKFKCIQCHQVGLDLEASEVGLILLGGGKNCNYRTYQFKSCGHTQEIQTSGGVRINNFICQTCDISHWNTKSGLYILEIKDQGFHWIKGGVAGCLDTRIGDYKLTKDAIVTKHFFKAYEDRHTSSPIEKEMLLLGKEYKLSKETMRPYMASGFDECYSIDILPLFLKYANELE